MFESLVGNEKTKELLENAISSNSVLHSYIFYGIDGIGKKLFAREFARKIMCLQENKIKETETLKTEIKESKMQESKMQEENKENIKCNCKSCIAFENGNNPDFMQIEPEEGKAVKIEQIRYLQEKIVEKPIISNKKVYIIDKSDTMTTEAQNCLLKTLEEPPEYAIIILIASNESKLLNTIKSRCIKISFQGIEQKELEKYIKNNISENISNSLIQACNGSIGRALKINEKLETYEKVEKFMQSIKKEDMIECWKAAEVLYKEKEYIQEILDYISIILYNNKDEKSIKAISYVEETKKNLLSNSNFDMSIDFLVMRMWEEINEKYSRG